MLNLEVTGLGKMVYLDPIETQHAAVPTLPAAALLALAALLAVGRKRCLRRR